MLNVLRWQTEEANWGTLRDYIRTTYNEDPDKYTDEIKTLYRLRQARGSCVVLATLDD